MIELSVGGTAMELIDLGLTNGREYMYQVEAVDSRGNRSGLSAAVTAIPEAMVAWREYADGVERISIEEAVSRHPPLSEVLGFRFYTKHRAGGLGVGCA